MRQLRGEDARFVYGESGHANSNITLISIYDPSTAPDGRVHFKGLLKHIESRLHLSPIFRQKLLRVPMELDFPYWIEDDDFDLEYHVRHIALPKPGDWRQFCIQASRIHARPLDLSKPLWELYLVEGLDAFLDLPPDSFAILAKVHHAAIDVRGGAEITTLLHDTTALPPLPEPPEPWFPESPPGSVSLLARALINNVVRPLMFAGPLARAVGKVTPAVLGSLGELLRKDRFAVTRFNSEVSQHRVFDSRRFPIGEFKRIRDLVPGATINDAVLAVCGGALRRYLLAHEELPGSSVVSLAPFSVRAAGASVEERPELSLVRVPLGTEIEDPKKRLRAIYRHTSTHAEVDQAVRAKELTEFDKHAPAATLALSAKLLAGSSLGSQREPLAGCTIMNVPGPVIPLYLDGARMTYFSAIMPIADGMGLVFSVTSYDGMIFISPTSCREQLPDPEFFAQCIRDSFQELLALTRKPKKAKKKKVVVSKAASQRKSVAKKTARRRAA
ncbi:MAG: wax ester/triacylglycerol synthase family O-acyltransferase [Gammaproteobacteria bacterium]|nr:wax ester/triacylglycerol synthase family O-acyltransferase [Gammaproteobacteria bacterium]MDH4311819.1 wax ester/triacylglycerol synthase family O-acyltransferase [Gammaproteobacteria bacterium]